MTRRGHKKGKCKEKGGTKRALTRFCKCRKICHYGTKINLTTLQSVAICGEPWRSHPKETQHRRRKRKYITTHSYIDTSFFFS